MTTSLQWISFRGGRTYHVAQGDVPLCGARGLVVHEWGLELPKYLHPHSVPRTCPGCTARVKQVSERRRLGIPPVDELKREIAAQLEGESWH